MQKELWIRALKNYRARRDRAMNDTHRELHAFLCDDLAERLSAMKRHVSDMLFVEAGPDSAAVQRCATAAGARRVVLIDTSAKMAARHPYTQSTVYDASGKTPFPFKHESFDVITGYVPLQCYPAPDQWLIHARALLRPGGMLLINFFGDSSFHEARTMMLRHDISISEKAASRMAPMIDIKSAGALLQRAGFTVCVSDVTRHKLEYDTLYALLHDIKKTGCNGITCSESHMPRAFYHKLKAHAEPLHVSADVITLTGELSM